MIDYLRTIAQNIPKELKEHKQWICWKSEINGNGKPAIVPKNPVYDYYASRKKPKHWVSFGVALANLHHFDGLGFVVSEDDPYVVWEFDDCCDYLTEEIDQETMTLIKRLNSYTEYSLLGNGIRIIVKASLFPLGRINSKIKIKVYDSNRYLAITGHHLEGTPTDVKYRSKVTENLQKKIFKPQIQKALKLKKSRHLTNQYMGIKPLFR